MITNNRKDIVDLDRHLNCHHYGCALRCPLRSYHLKKGEELTIDSEKHFMFVFVEARSSSYSYRDETERHACRGDFFLFLGTQRTVTIYGEGKDTTVHTFFFSKPTQLCDNYAISQLKDKAPTSSHVFISLPTHESIKMVLDSMLYMHNHQLNCINIYESKLKELFFYLGAFYEREQVAWLLAPLLHQEIDFKEFVVQNFLRAKTVQDLADQRGMPVRVFKKKFQESFNMPPYTWMLQEKAKYIDLQLADAAVPFSEIIKEFGFSSPSHFTVFCRRQYDMTPTQRRHKLLREKARAEMKEK